MLSPTQFQSTLPARGATAQQFSIYFKIPFQSTLPARGATHWKYTAGAAETDFNPRSPHGERRQKMQSGCVRQVISIHAPRTGSDRKPVRRVDEANHFNPRSPHGERRGIERRFFGCVDFNPRSPHGERPSQALPASRQKYFNPRSPHGERHISAIAKDKYNQFQSTLPARGATRWRTQKR